MGRRLYALEKNILKFRAFEMVLILFYAEGIKQFALDAIRSTDQWRETAERIPLGTKSIYRKVWKLLVCDGVLTQAESDELQCLIGYRDDVAHRVYQLTADISRDPGLRDFADALTTKYNCDARRRLKQFRQTLSTRMSSRYVLSISFDGLLFDAAESTYQKELERLHKKISRQLSDRKLRSKVLSAELLAAQSFNEDVDLYHPHNRMRNGRLTERGIKVCHALFDQGRSPLAVAYLMGTSYEAASKRYRDWRKSK